MTDIVERLRKHSRASKGPLPTGECNRDCGEGADEIERLRAEVEGYRIYYNKIGKGFRRDGILEAARLMENAFGDKYAAKAIRSLAGNDHD